MKIIIIGTGEVGYHLAKLLSRENHDLTLVEIEEEKCARAMESLDANVIQGSGTDLKIMESVCANEPDMLIAVTLVDEVNIVSCMIAHRLGVKMKIARLRNSDYSRKESVLSPMQLGINHVIHPEMTASNEIVQLIKRSSANEIWEFGDGKVQLIGFRLPNHAPVLGKKLYQIAAEITEMDFRAVAIVRDGETIIPGGNDEFLVNDELYVIAVKKSIGRLLELVGRKDEKLNAVTILGGGKIGRTVAAMLRDDCLIKLIESDEKKAEKIASDLPNTLVCEGDGMDMDFMAVEGFADADGFIAVTADDEDNIMASLLAKRFGVKKIITHVSNSSYSSLVHQLGLDSTVSKQMTTVNAIMQFVRKDDVLAITEFDFMDLKAVEMIPYPNSHITKHCLADVKFPKTAVVGAVFRGDEVIIPVGTTRIQTTDKVLVFSEIDHVNKVEKLFLK
ncbi:MAG: Trk system potassium transporter TrkA [Candidatus Marinimicrobia bacterium]|nr:Trk system potassium transporter TrkA [Candidatus Neomarinimicrobiota bacterium]